MGFVMFREQNFFFIADFPADHFGNVEFFSEPQGHGFQPGSEPFRRHGKIAHEKAVKGQDRFVVENNMVKILNGNSPLLQTVFDGLCRKSWIMFFP